MRNIFLMLLFFMNLHSYAGELSTIDKKNLGVSNAETKTSNNSGISGLYILDRIRKDALKFFPNGKEYERIAIKGADGRYEITYFGVYFDGDHNDLGFFVVKAANIRVEGNMISFDLPMRYFFPSKNAPHSIEEVDGLRKNRFSTGASSEKISLKGHIHGRTLELHCTSEYGGVDCYSDTMTFREE